MKKKYILGILDGWGISDSHQYNAILAAQPKTYDMLIRQRPNTTLITSGSAVGLPDGQMGNSEVGHLTIGSGRVVYQDLTRITKSIETGELREKLEYIRQYHMENPSARCHIISMISDGGVHSHIDHLMASSKILQGIDIVLHAISDGRDAHPRSCLNYISMLKNNRIKIGSLSGRYYAMDRDNRKERTALSYKAILLGEGPSFLDPEEYVKSFYSATDKSDEFILPGVSANYDGYKKGDTIFITNFRADRIRQLLTEIINGDLNIDPNNLIGMSSYGDEFDGKIKTLFSRGDIVNTLGEVISDHGMKQVRLAETEKYAHVTYFFNGGKEEAFSKEERILVPSPKIATYDLAPEMSIVELTDKIIEYIESDEYDFICFNFANADMVGHTGNMNAAIKAIKAIDESLSRIYSSVLNTKSEMLITADHGNAEYMYDEYASSPHTAHTTNRVPLIYVGSKEVKLKSGGLMDVAPTMLSLMGIPKPSEMSGMSLIIE